jgi:nicotinamide-nucleotide amidase
MNAWIVAVGSEMLTPFRTDTNSLAITERLNAIGFDVRMKVVVGDRLDDIVGVFARGIGEVELIVCTGGLGPTEDDLTRDALARVLDAPLDVDEGVLERLRQRFAQRGMAMPDINRRQALVPRGAVLVENTRGTAPGLWVERNGTSIVLLPGPPREMIPMIERVIDERLRARAAGTGLFRRVLKIAGRAESDVDARAQPVYGRWVDQPVPITTTILAAMGQIELHLTAAAPGRVAAESALDAAAVELQQALGASVYTTTGEMLEAIVGRMLRERQLTIAVAESCSGGLLASRLTDVPGSSEYFDRGFVCYSNRAKVEWLDVPEALLEQHGAVSEPVARAMADGVRSRAATAVGIGITGIAGPGGGTPEKPVGMVAIAVVTPDDARVRTFQFFGGRDMVKFQSAQTAMNMLRLMLLGSQAEPSAWMKR